jgi:hypothetical protein
MALGKPEFKCQAPAGQTNAETLRNQLRDDECGTQEIRNRKKVKRKTGYLAANPRATVSPISRSLLAGLCFFLLS